MVACGPPGLNGDTNILYHNNGDGTFTDVSAKSGILKANGNFGLGVLTGDFDNDGWPDIYVADDSTASALYKNLHDGRFVDVGMEAGCVLSADGKPQAGMGVSAADYDLDGNLDIVKTNFAGDTPSLYHNRGNSNSTTPPSRQDSARTPSTWAGAAASSTTTTMAGPTFCCATDTSIPKSSS